MFQIACRYHSWYHTSMDVLTHAAAAREYRGLPEREQDAMDNAIAKLQALGEQLGFPHSSAVKGGERLRELRPRAGRSRWRAFYRCIGDKMVIGAFGPEASVDSRGFQVAVQLAIERLAAYEARES